MKTRFLTGDVNWIDYGGKWISPKQNNGDFDYWLVVSLTNMDDACGRDNEGQPKYVVEVHAVSPDSVSAEDMKRALECCGMDNYEGELTDEMKVECLDSYGIHAPCDSWSGNNAHKLLRTAHKALDTIAGMFGFFMDGSKNAIGHTGWDCIKGDLSIGTAMVNREGKDGPTPNMHIVG